GRATGAAEAAHHLVTARELRQHAAAHEAEPGRAEDATKRDTRRHRHRTCARLNRARRHHEERLAHKAPDTGQRPALGKDAAAEHPAAAERRRLLPHTEERAEDPATTTNARSTRRNACTRHAHSRPAEP